MGSDRMRASRGADVVCVNNNKGRSGCDEGDCCGGIANSQQPTVRLMIGEVDIMCTRQVCEWQWLGGHVVWGECVDLQTALIVGCLWFCSLGKCDGFKEV